MMLPSLTTGSGKSLPIVCPGVGPAGAGNVLAATALSAPWHAAKYCPRPQAPRRGPSKRGRWIRIFAAMAAVVVGVGVVLPATLHGQEAWNTPRVRVLVERATTLRLEQLADTGLQSYKAEARGYLSFLAQLGEGFRLPPKLVRTDQIASDIYWRAPDISKQFIKGRRDTLLLPTDISYHRDHLGIIQNNFPNIIRLGDGDEVEDVPHPLSPTGLNEYDFAIRDSLQIRLGPARAIDVYEIRVRPKNDREPRAIGSIYLDRESASVVRMTLSFTRVALKDQDLEDVTVVLENGLIEGRFWLPRRQEIEIRRTGTWLDYPARGIIRGWWEISNYEVNAVPKEILLGGPEIMAAPGSRVTQSGRVTHPNFSFEGNILDALPPDVQAASDDEVRKVQEEARELVRAQALSRARSRALSARRLSDLVRVNRVEGFALGTGMMQRLGDGLSVAGYTSYGFSDRDWKIRGGFTYTRPSGATLAVMGYRGLADVADVMERSTLVNSFAAQEFASDYTNPYFVRGVSLSAGTSTRAPVRGSLGFAFERHDSVSVHAVPAQHTYQPTLGIQPFQEIRATLGFDIPTQTIAGLGVQGALRVHGIRGKEMVPGAPYHHWARANAQLDITREFGGQRLWLQTIGAGIVGRDTVPLQHLVYMGGPLTAPGYRFHQFAGRAAVSQRVEWQFGVPFAGIPLGAWGKAPAKLTLAPYANGAWIQDTGWRPSVGMGVLALFDLLRFDVSYGIRDKRWQFGFDLSRDFWGVL